MKQKDFVILLDMDDVLVNLKKHWVDWLNTKYDLNVNHLDITAWGLKTFFPSLTDEEIWSPLFETEFWSSVTPKDGAIHCVKKLIDEGFQVYVVTASHPETLPNKLNDCLFKYFPFIDSKSVIASWNKQLICGDVLIDDNPLNLIGGTYKSILMDASHNRDFDNRQHHIPRFYGWSEDLYEYIVNLYETSVAVESESKQMLKHFTGTLYKNNLYDKRFYR